MKVQEIVDIAPRENFTDGKFLQFQRLGIDYFGISEKKLPDKLEDLIEYYLRYNIFKLPFEINEFFIDINNLGKSFLVEYFYLNEAAKKSNEVRKLQFVNRQIESFFHKWVDAQNFEAKLYYSRSIFEKIQKDYSKIINLIILGILFAEEETLLDLNEAARLFDKAITIFERMASKTKITERIIYVLYILNGLIHLKMDEVNEAIYYFSSAIKYSNWAANAKFYLAYAYAILGESEKTADYLNQIYKLDQKKLNFFITSNQLKLFKFSIDNCFLTHIFDFKVFSGQFEFIEQLISEKADYGYDALKRIEQKAQGLNEKRSAKYLLATHTKELTFINKIIADYKETCNFWVLSSFETIENKIDKIINSIIENVKNYYKEKLEKHEELYDEKIKSETQRIKDLEASINSSIAKVEEEFREKKNYLEHQVKTKCDLLKVEIENLENSKNEISLKSFSSSLMYSLMISIFVFLTGGFAEYTADYSAVDSNLTSAMFVIIAHGVKWGIMAFTIGLVVSAFSSVSSVLKLYTKKQRLQKQLSKADSVLKIGIRQLEMELEERKRYATERSKSLVKNHDKNIENLKKEKERKINELREEYNKLSEEEIKPFLELKEIY